MEQVTDTAHIIGPLAVAPTVFVVLGPPGAGKTTLALSMSQEMKADLLCTSQFLAEMRERHPDDDLRILINENFRNGTNIDDERVHEAIVKKLANFKSNVKFIEGFPRTKNAAKRFREWIGQENHKVVILHVFADLNTCRNRFLSKDYRTDLESMFAGRIKNYSQIERGIMLDLDFSTIVNVDTTD